MFGLPDPAKGEEVTAVIVPEDGAELDAATVRARLKEIMSSYKVPTRIHLVDGAQIPYLGSGKPDKITLKARTAELPRPDQS